LVEQLKVDIKYGRIDDAIVHGEAAVVKEPSNPIAHFLLGQAYIYASRWLDATSELNEALKLDSAGITAEIEKDPSRFWTPYYNGGVELMKKDDYEGASQLFVQASKIDPSKPESYNNMGFAYLMLGEEEKMIESYQKSIELDSANVDAYYNLGFYYNSQGDREAAMTYMQKAEAVAVPELQKYENQFFELHSEPMGEDERVEHLRKLRFLEESQRKEILASKVREEDADRAGRILAEIDKRSTRLGEILSIKGLVHLNGGDEAEAQAVLEKALLYSQDNPDTYFYLILALQRQENYDAALPYLTKMAEIDPTDIRAWFQLGVSHFRTGDYDQALEAFTKAIELNPNYPDAYVNRGNVYAKKADLMKEQGRSGEEKALRDRAKQDFAKADALEKAGGSD
jgi:tetratricopeptide (TPR) repeat protein